MHECMHAFVRRSTATAVGSGQRLPAPRDGDDAMSGRFPDDGVGTKPPNPGDRAEQLVTIEAQREFDLFSGEWAERVFVKLYVAARTSGLLAAISDREWKTLCTLATYMDGQGFCFPSQAELARAMGCSRQMANERVKSLAEFRFQGQPVLVTVKAERDGGKWGRNGYRVLGLANLRIYEGGEDPEPANDSGNDSGPGGDPPCQENLTRSSQNSVTVSRRTVSGELDTNKNHLIELELDRSNIRMAQAVFALEERRAEAAGESPNAAAPPPETTAPVVLPLGEAIAVWRARQQAAAEAGIGRGPSGNDPPDRATPEPPPGPKPESDGDLPRPQAPRRRRQEDPDYQLLQNVMRDVAREFHDRAPLGSTTTRAHNLWRRSGLGIQAFVDKLYAARAVVKERTPAIRATGHPNAAGFSVKHGIGYFFAVVEDLCGLRPDESANLGG